MTSFDGSKIARQHRTGSSMAAMLNHMPKAPIRDHSKANKLALREKQQQIRENRMRAELEEDRTAWKMKEFANVPSKAMREMQNLQRPKSSDGLDIKHHFLQKSQGKMMKPAPPPREPTPPPMKPEPKERKPLIPTKIATMGANIPRNNPNRNFIAENRKAAKDADAISAKEFDAEVERLTKMFGNQNNIEKDDQNVPTYLHSIKQEIQDKKQAAWEAYQREQSDVPAGMRVLPESERIETLESLQQKHTEFEELFRKLPLKIETEGQKQRQREIQLKLKELEKAIHMFQRPRVLVKME